MSEILPHEVGERFFKELADFTPVSGASIDWLFTDVVTPGELAARDLARKAQQKLPGLPVLFTSGYTDNAIAHGGRLDEGVELLSKPYTRDELALKLRKMFSPRPASAAEQALSN